MSSGISDILSLLGRFSDQSDPFTRQPLNMDMIKPNVELKAEVDVWMAEYQLKKSENIAAAVTE
jgi:hypothetical protein